MHRNSKFAASFFINFKVIIMPCNKGISNRDVKSNGLTTNLAMWARSVDTPPLKKDLFLENPFFLSFQYRSSDLYKAFALANGAPVTFLRFSCIWVGLYSIAHKDSPNVGSAFELSATVIGLLTIQYE
jgi:hypothetical protein